jgi:hypothetical protein
LPLLPLVPGAGGPAGGSCCQASDSVVVPAAEVTWAEVAPALSGHQATNQPSATVDTTFWPSSRTSVTPVTPLATRPSTSVYGPSLVDRWLCVTCVRSPEAVPPPNDTLDMPPGPPFPTRTDSPGAAEILVEPDAAPAEPPDETMLTCVNEELVKQEAYAPSFWNRATVKGPRTSVSTFSHGPEPRLDAPGPDGIVVSWLWQLAAAEVEGELEAAVGAALQPA